MSEVISMEEALQEGLETVSEELLHERSRNRVLLSTVKQLRSKLEELMIQNENLKEIVADCKCGMITHCSY